MTHSNKMENETTSKASVVHLTSVHPRYDTRIFYKECVSLSTRNFNVTLVVADGKGDEIKQGVNILDVGATKGRLSRLLNTPSKVFEKALALRAEVYHLHDPELMPIGRKLQNKGFKVIFDAHEDFPQQLANKKYLNKFVRFSLSKLAKYYENYVFSKFNGLVAATPTIRDKCLQLNNTAKDINNFPRLSFINQDEELDFSQRNGVCYIGGITLARGIKETLSALEYTGAETKLNLAGKFFDKNLEQEANQLETWQKVTFYGWLNHTDVQQVLDESVAGLVTLHPISNYLESLPVKMFEYMANGLPVIYSDIKYWDELIGEEDCGIKVDPYDPKQIADAINFLINNKEKAKEMGARGKQLVIEKFNWGIEEQKLVDLYNEVLSQ